jgi:hypothetical protein
MIAVPEHHRPTPVEVPDFDPAAILNNFMRNEVPTDPDLLAKARDAMRNIGPDIINRQFDPKGEQVWRIRPSGQKCTRAEVLKKCGYGSLPLATRGVFSAGDFGEAFTIAMMELTGEFKIVGYQLPLTIPGPEGTTYRGTLDILVMVGHKLYVIDVKTATAKGMNKIVHKGELKTGGDPWGYKKQLKTYMLAGEYPLDGGFLLYMNKEYWNQWASVYVPGPTEQDKARWFEHCKDINDSTADPETWPARPAWATVLDRPRAEGPAGGKGCYEIEHMVCSYCSCVQKCFEDVGDFQETRPKQWRAEK